MMSIVRTAELRCAVRRYRRSDRRDERRAESQATVRDRRREDMNSTKKAARTAGVLYFFSSLPAPFSLLYIPSVFMVMGDATATANKIRTSPLLFRVGIVAELISATTFIFMGSGFIGLAFYHLLKGVNKKHALLMLTLVLISVPISFLNELNRVAALMLSNGAHIAGALEQPQLDALAMAFFHLHGSGLLLAQIFWGLWLFPFGGSCI